MDFFELEPKDITDLSDGDLRDLVGRLAEAELLQQNVMASCVLWGGAQEAPDGGLDVEVNNAGDLTRPGFVPRSYTGFQVKKHTMNREACKKEMQYKGEVKAVINALAERGGAYIIVSGRDNCSSLMLKERIAGMNSAMVGAGRKDQLLLDFYGRDRLASWLRQHPGVALWARMRLGKPLSGWKPHGRWAATPSEQDDAFLADDYLCVTDTSSKKNEKLTLSEGVRLVREKLTSSSKAVRITGLSGVGKTRFAQALFEEGTLGDALPSSNVIYADLGDDLVPTASALTNYLTANSLAAYLVLDNCPPDVHRQLQRELSTQEAKVRLVTIEYDISGDRPEETEVIHLEPSSEKVVSTLLKKRFPGLGTVNSDRIAEFSGGNARIALALASRVEADETLANLRDEDLFLRLFYQRKGNSDDLLAAAEALSLVYSFDVSKNEQSDELGVLGSIAGPSRRSLYRHQAELLDRQLCQQRGNWRAILPHALANRLAKRALRSIPPDELNKELFKPENLRLFKSCAHRVGYLHDFEPAIKLARTWVEAPGPLHHVSSCSDELMVALEHITPVLPNGVLAALELAARDPNFASRGNEQFRAVVRLLRKLAYDDENFDRAASIILKIGETEKPDENRDSVVKVLEQLFSLYLSGTHASPERRQRFLSRLLTSENKNTLAIAKRLLSSAFETQHWSSSDSFEFGARSRDHGWIPPCEDDAQRWYSGFIRLLEASLESTAPSRRRFALEVLSDHFQQLWSYGGCADSLERIVLNHTGEGGNPSLWLGIKRALNFDSKKLQPALLARLQELESLAAPRGLRSEIEAYVFSNTWDQLDPGGDYEKQTEEIARKVEKLGELAASDSALLHELGPRFWSNRIDVFAMFGRGLAKGTLDPYATFLFLTDLLSKHEIEDPEPLLLYGFIQGVHRQDPGLSRRLQELVPGIPKLKPYSVFLLCATPIESWGTQKLLEFARTGEIEAWRFAHIASGRKHEEIGDRDLIVLLAAVNQLEDGIPTTLEVLTMRFFRIEENDYSPTEEMLSFGRKSVNQLFMWDERKISFRQIHGIDKVVEVCFQLSVPLNEVEETVSLLCEGFASGRLFPLHLEQTLSVFIRRFPELVLDMVFVHGAHHKSLAYSTFRDRIANRRSPLNSVPVQRIEAWCAGDDERIQHVLNALTLYSTITDKGFSDQDSPSVEIDGHVLALLDVAKDKAAVVDVIFNRTRPYSGSGSLATLLEHRTKAFSSLASHPSPEVRTRAQAKLPLLEQLITDTRRREAERDSEFEQRFE